MKLEWQKYRRFPLATDLSVLHGFLSKQGFPHKITEEGGEQIVWFPAHENSEHLNAFLDRFLAGDVDLPQDEAPASSPSITVLLSSLLLSPITYIQIFLGALGYVVIDVIRSETTFLYFAFKPLDQIVLNYEWWRLITPAFFHFSIAHFAFNAVGILILGKQIERTFNKKHYILLFLITAITANIVQYFFVKSIWFGGLSGVVYGYLGFVAVAVYVLRFANMQIPLAMIIISLLFMGLGFLGGLDWLVGGSIANWAHLGGFLGGVLYAVLYFCITRFKVEKN